MRIETLWTTKASGGRISVPTHGSLAFLSDGSAINLETGAAAWKASLASPSVLPVALPDGGAAFIDSKRGCVRVDRAGVAAAPEKLAVAGEMAASGPRASWVSEAVTLIDDDQSPPVFVEPLPKAKIVELVEAKSFELPPRLSPVMLFAAGAELVVMCDERVSAEEDPQPASVIFSGGRVVLQRSKAETLAVDDGLALLSVPGETRTLVETATGKARGEFPASADNSDRFALAGDVLISVNCVSGEVRRLNAKGEAQWTTPLSGFKKALWYLAPVVSAGVCWFVGQGGKLAALDVTSGEEVSLPKGTPKFAPEASLFRVSDGVVILSGETLTRFRAA
ncbi:MAG: hypothetical protein QM817_18875 [Archangium sp.]